MKTLFHSIADRIIKLSRGAKRRIAFSSDVIMCVLATWFAFYLRLGEIVSIYGPFFLAATVSVGLAIPIFIALGFYRVIFRFSGFAGFLSVSKAVGIYGVIYFLVFAAYGLGGVPRTVGIIQPILLLFLVGLSRALARAWLGGRTSGSDRRARSNVLIYGAGTAGRQLAAAIINSHEMHVVGFLDDDPRLHRHLLNGQPIYDPANLGNLVLDLGVSDVLLAMPSLSRGRRNEIINLIGEGLVAVRTVPSVSDLATGRVSIADLRELGLDDLLGREAVQPDPTLMSENNSKKVVLVTGAGGSIGGELCRQILATSPRVLLLVDHNEFTLYAIHRELEEKGIELGIKVIPLLGSVQDGNRINEIMSTWRPDTVYHAAAYKHVPLVEQNLVEGIKNNAIGTLVIARSALTHRVSNVVLVSTDKAVRPTNVMGASKRLAEMIFQAQAVNSPFTKFSMVRFGNVLGSSGSVVPKFLEQIRNGGPVSVTHQEITRYFMTIPEAAQLVIQAGAMSLGGDVFVLDMGDPVSIMDLARKMINLSGFSVKDENNPEGDIEIEVTGLRPGEKLFEELLIGYNSQKTSHPRIMRANEEFLVLEELETKLEYLTTAMRTNDANIIRSILNEIVIGYSPSSSIVDWVYLEGDS